MLTLRNHTHSQVALKTGHTSQSLLNSCPDVLEKEWPADNSKSQPTAA